MPRPTVAQLACGSCTVVFSTFVMLLLSGASSAPAVAVVAVSALALGLVVAMKVPHLAPRRPAAVHGTAAPEPVRATVPSPVREKVREPVRERAAS
ncbi:hypothetical protein BU52_11275 [Streptomyces toyocaensis]|uniref:Uncharacterized protein n=2 Tax=Streptomyces toyocaensis TaxID=55952 RepID=A0A081XUD8_STRTO|nr:hypothetical protein [Streptomyces toyocaensis]KES07161.1 hypothetical protein BU52_11275 [Streptomyces toyocaensis]